MAERPDFEGVLAEHLPRDRYRDDGECVGTYCTCGNWTGDYFADGESGPFDIHLATALNTEVDRWLAEVVSTIRGMAVEQFDRTGPYNARGAAIWDVAAWIDEHLALAALTTPTEPTTEQEGVR